MSVRTCEDRHQYFTLMGRRAHHDDQNPHLGPHPESKWLLRNFRMSSPSPAAARKYFKHRELTLTQQLHLKWILVQLQPRLATLLPPAKASSVKHIASSLQNTRSHPTTEGGMNMAAWHFYKPYSRRTVDWWICRLRRWNNCRRAGQDSSVTSNP